MASDGGRSGGSARLRFYRDSASGLDRRESRSMPYPPGHYDPRLEAAVSMTAPTTTCRCGHVLRALDLLVSEGYAAREAGPRGSKMHASIRPFREAEDTGNRSVPE